MAYEKGLCAFGLKDYDCARKSFRTFLASEHAAAETDCAKRALDIVEHNFIAQVSGDYLKSATGQGARRWADASHSLKVYIEEKPSLDGYRADLEPMLKQAFADWSEGSKCSLISNSSVAR